MRYKVAYRRDNGNKLILKEDGHLIWSNDGTQMDLSWARQYAGRNPDIIWIVDKPVKYE